MKISERIDELYEHQEQRDSMIHALGAVDFLSAMCAIRYLMDRNTAEKSNDGHCPNCEKRTWTDGDFCCYCGQRLKRSWSE